MCILLAGLVERLVGDEQDLRLGLDVDLALQLFLAELGARGDEQQVLPRRHGRHAELGVGHAIGAGLALEKLIKPCPWPGGGFPPPAPASGIVSVSDLTPCTPQRMAARLFRVKILTAGRWMSHAPWRPAPD